MLTSHHTQVRTRSALSALTCLLLLLSGRAGAHAPDCQDPTRITSWNAYSRQFIDPPTFTLLTIPGTAQYRARIAQADQSWTVVSSYPRLSLSGIWGELAMKKFVLTFEWADAQGKVIASEPATDRVKAPDFAGFHEPAADWKSAADRGTAYLIGIGENGKAPYREPGVPVWIWSAYTGDKNNPGGGDVSYPCITLPNIVWGMVAYERTGGPLSERAMTLARQTADWCLQHRQPDSGALPLFPYSTVSHGHIGGGADGQGVNLLRASWLALGLMDLYEATGRHDARYLEYARHIATVTAKFQALDGSFPYRINPGTGAVIDAFTPAAIEFARLIDALRPYGVSDDLLKAQQGAVRWMVHYVAGANHWQAIFEDVVHTTPFANLSQFETQIMIRYLCRHRDEDPAYLPLAERLNRWVEDQFVIFGPESEAYERHVKGPLVFEQFACWYPMEGHTGFWINSLLDLHQATGKTIYLEKAEAAGNATCAQQFEDGSFSTWGARTCANGKVTGENTGGNWYNANVIATQALYRLDAYCRDLPGKPVQQ